MSERGSVVRLRLPAPLVGVVPEARPDVAEDVAAQDAEQRRLREREREQRWVAISRQRFALVRWADVDQPPAVKAELAAWRAAAVHHFSAAGPRPGNLVLIGPSGVGKTYAALAIAKDLHYAGASVVFAPILEMLGAMRRAGREFAVGPYAAAQVLVLDDLGIERTTDWTREQCLEIINARWLDARPTIVTTNLDPPELAGAIGEPTWDRLKHDTVVVRVTGPSRRRPA